MRSSPGEKVGTRTFISNLGGIIRSTRTLCPNIGGNIKFLNASNQGNKSKFQEGTEHSNRKVGAVFIASSNFSFILIEDMLLLTLLSIAQFNQRREVLAFSSYIYFLTFNPKTILNSNNLHKVCFPRRQDDLIT